ncbi:uncharacterized protein LOC122259178 isoform X2 [Penaeus japonicus]|uniref:uncharacterized protein LOC122259178 isoform X2 n=1 Tax=Penaeus japonicus TaxID=27405 RepID=UPI001C70C1D3|nr:uncharacterized protein LOC122259178 isoform X2 [Penaeus japonicus]
MSYGGRMNSEKISSHGGAMRCEERATSELTLCRCGAERPKFPELCVRVDTKTCDTLRNLNNKLLPQTGLDLVYVQCSGKTQASWESQKLSALHSCDQDGCVGESCELEPPSGIPPGIIPPTAASFPSHNRSSPKIFITYPSLAFTACTWPVALALPPVASYPFPPSAALGPISISSSSSSSSSSPSQPVVSYVASASAVSRPDAQSDVCSVHDSCRYSDAAPFAPAPPAPAPACVRLSSCAPPQSSSITPLPSNPTPSPTSTLFSPTRRVLSKEASSSESRRENTTSFSWPRAGLAKRDNGLSLQASSQPLFGFILKNRLTSRIQKDAMWRGRQTQLLRILATILALMTTSAVAYELKPTTTLSKVTLAGLTASLPCELPLPVDRPTLILWYKDQATKPFYSYDARETAAGHHKVHDKSELGTRSHFRLETFPHNFKTRLGFLDVKKVTLADSGNYTCRVDFMTSQTMMSLLQLTVHEEIRDLEVFDAYGTMIGKVVGPYKLLSRVMLSCRAYGGHPPPVVRWMDGDRVLETSSAQHYSAQSPSERGEAVRVVDVTLHLPGLQRDDNGRDIKCVASNTNLTQEKVRVVTIDMYLPPLEVTVDGLDAPLRAGIEAILMCRSVGSLPTATLSWRLHGSSSLMPLPAQSSLDQNTTIGRGRLLPTPRDNGRALTCTASNPKVKEYFLNSTHTLQVLFAPEVSVRLAPALDPDNIWEKADVYFECVIQANPQETKVVWLHEGQELRGDSENGLLADRVLVQGQNLVLQKVTRHAQGRYQCRVTNTIDTVTSSATILNVMFAPECKKPRNETVSVTPNEEVKLNCLVEANPPDVTFVWKINSSRGVKELESSSYSSRSRSSTLVYRPSTHAHGTDHYGVVFCLGSNKAGKQRLPCMFIISPAGPPEKPKSCTFVNQSPTSLAMTCQPGHDGGLDQHFIATVEDAATRRVVANVTSASPDLTVEGLAPGRDYLVKVTAVNQKGRSSPFTLEGFALKVAENKINNSGAGESSSLLVVFVAVIVGFVFILSILALATRARLRHRRGHPEVKIDKNKLSTGDEAPLSPSTNASLDEIGDGEMLHTPESHTGPLETLEITAQTPESPVSCSSRTYVPVPTGSSTLPRPHSQMNPRPQPLHSVDLPHVTSNNHKYYTLKINCTRQNNESFV